MIRGAFAALSLCMLAASEAALADEMPPAKRADIKTLMQISGFANPGNQFVDLATVQIVQRLQAGGRTDLPQQL